MAHIKVATVAAGQTADTSVHNTVQWVQHALRTMWRWCTVCEMVIASLVSW